MAIGPTVECLDKYCQKNTFDELRGSDLLALGALNDE